MTPEAKAREIVSHLPLQPSTVRPTPVVDAVDLIAQALRDVERETLERAAKVAAEWDVRRVMYATDGILAPSTAGRMIAQSILSLLQKEGG